MQALKLAALLALAGISVAAADAPALKWTLKKGTAIVLPRVAYPSGPACAAGAASQPAGTYKCEQDPVVNVVVVGAPVMAAGLFVNRAKMTARGVGSSTDDIIAVPTDLDALALALPTPSSDGSGDFRTVCNFSHWAFDDPIVYPGQPGASHLHAFFGNTGANANSTAASLASTGNSTCRGGTINRSAYWMPGMLDTLDGTPVKPRTLLSYYKTGYNQVPTASIQPMPAGLRMVAGDPKNTTPVGGPTRFSCGPVGRGPGDPWPAGIPLDCPVGSEVWAVVQFPQCWDGINLDSPDHRSHMAYGNTDGAAARNGGPPLGCPVTHPVALAEITLNVAYPVTSVAALKRWRLASDTYAGPAGYSLHADWFNGWKPDVATTWATKCVAAGMDCQAHKLGDGRTMAEAKP